MPIDSKEPIVPLTEREAAHVGAPLGVVGGASVGSETSGQRSFNSEPAGSVALARHTRARDTVTLVCDHTRAEAARDRWLFPMLGCWPSEPAATPKLVELGEQEHHEHDQIEGVALVIADSAAMADVALDLCAQRHPVLVVSDEPERFAQHAEAGLVVEPTGASASHLASVAYALARRQPCVDALQSEVARTSRSMGGLAEEFTRFQDEMHMAASVQRDLLPKSLPQLEGLRSGVLYRPCGFVSGDIYDVRVLPDGRLSFLLADAVGHGVPAALLTMVIAHAMPTNGHLHERGDPAEVLRRLNVALCERQTETTRFVTAVAGVIDPVTGRAVVSGAGHPPPLHVGDGSDAVSTTGPLLGVFEEAEFDSAEIELAPGESLLCYTDGFETAYPTKDDAAAGRVRASAVHLDRLAAIVREARDGGTELCTAMRSIGFDVDAQSGSLHQPDDLTALAFLRPMCESAKLAA